jgi:hypothetical protein
LAVHGDLSSGQSYALKIVEPTGDRTGEAEWVALDQTVVETNADNAAAAAGATGYNRPEDVEIATSTGNNRGGANTLYVAVTGPTDNRILAIDLRESKLLAGTKIAGPGRVYCRSATSLRQFRFGYVWLKSRCHCFTSKRLAGDQLLDVPEAELARTRHHILVVGSVLVVNCETVVFWLTTGVANDSSLSI